MKKLGFLIAILALCIVGVAQSSKSLTTSEAEAAAEREDAARSLPHSPDSTTTCNWTFTSGTGNAYLQFCVTVNGNITEFQTPLGHEHIALGTIGEGYGVCNESPAIEYHDWAGFGDSGNWNAPSTVSFSSTSVTIKRTTSDGIWTLVQTISQVAGNSEAKIAMKLTNNTSTARVAYLVRYADISADGRFLNTLDSTHNSAGAWNTTGSTNPYGAMLQNFGTPQFGFWNGYAQNTFLPPNACNFAGNYVGGPLTGTNGSVVVAYVGSVPAHSTRIATMTYKGM